MVPVQHNDTRKQLSIQVCCHFVRKNKSYDRNDIHFLYEVATTKPNKFQ